MGPVPRDEVAAGVDVEAHTWARRVGPIKVVEALPRFRKYKGVADMDIVKLRGFWRRVGGRVSPRRAIAALL